MSGNFVVEIPKSDAYTSKREAANRRSTAELEFDRETAENWVHNMQNEDKAHPVGGKWTAEMIKPLAEKHGMPTDGERFWELYAMTNAMYSDYGEVAR